MNTSWLSLGQTALALFALTQSFFIIAQFKLPQRALKSLAYATSLSISLALGFDALMWHGFNILFHFPQTYSVLIGLVAWSWLGIVLFGLVDEPSQLHRKILWRLPLIGGMLGYAVPLWVSVGLLSVIWIGGFVVMAIYKKKFNYTFRLYVGNLVVVGFHVFCLNLGYILLSQLCYAFWIVLVHRILASFLIKDQIFEKLVRPKKEVPV